MCLMQMAAGIGPIVAIVLLVFSDVVEAGCDVSSPGGSASAGSWVLTFEDDFNGNALNESNWTPSNSSFTSQYDGHDALFVLDAVSVSQGNLAITTWLHPQKVNGILYNFASGWIDTQGKVSQSFGRFEAHMMMPDRYSIGSWPAWWLLPQDICWPIGGEIDIIEWYGGDNGHYQHSTPGNPSSMISTYHYGYYCYTDASHYSTDSRWYPNTTDWSAPIIDFSA